MKWEFDSRYPSIEDLRNKARGRIPRFAFEYLDGGCNEDINLYKNTFELEQIELKPFYLSKVEKSLLTTELFGHVYDAPFGIAPIGLQGLIWPNAPKILAKAAAEHNIPFILSTVTTSNIEEISEMTEGRAWFQLYHPKENSLRDDILSRLVSANYKILIVLSDVPSFGYRPRDIRNGLAMSPKMTLNNILQIILRPRWAKETLYYGKPSFATMNSYIPKDLDLKQLGKFMNNTFSGQLSPEKISQIRDKWKGKLIIKGIVSEQDVEKAIELGVDGIIVSNHGGRQLDAGQSSIKSLEPIVQKYKGKIKIMMDSGIRSGPDVARALASGAEFTFLGRAFMYGVAALGKKGGDHSISVLKSQLLQVMEQLNCHKTLDLPDHLVSEVTSTRSKTTSIL